MVDRHGTNTAWVSFPCSERAGQAARVAVLAGGEVESEVDVEVSAFNCPSVKLPVQDFRAHHRRYLRRWLPSTREFADRREHVSAITRAPPYGRAISL
jgi:hypothetical protein